MEHRQRSATQTFLYFAAVFVHLVRLTCNSLQVLKDPSRLREMWTKMEQAGRSGELIQLTKRMLAPEIADRITAREILESPMFNRSRQRDVEKTSAAMQTLALTRAKSEDNRDRPQEMPKAAVQPQQHYQQHDHDRSAPPAHDPRSRPYSASREQQPKSGMAACVLNYSVQGYSSSMLWQTQQRRLNWINCAWRLIDFNKLGTMKGQSGASAGRLRSIPSTLAACAIMPTW